MKNKFKPSSVIIFQESDGWHYSSRSLDYLDARGKGYPSSAAALRAARDSHEMHEEMFEECQRISGQTK